MRIFLLASLLCSFQLLAVPASGADKPDGVYVGADVGFSGIRDADIDLVGAAEIAHRMEFDSGLAYGFQLGYGFSGPRIEVDLRRRENDVDEFGPASGVADGTGSIDSTSLMFNALYDFKIGSKLFPYIGLGVGGARVKADKVRKRVSAPNRTGVVDGDDRVFAWNLIVGAAYKVTDSLSFKLDYRFMRTDDIRYGYGVGCNAAGASCVFNGDLDEDDYQAHNISVGMRWEF